jgi:hypothetical protein
VTGPVEAREHLAALGAELRSVYGSTGSS